MTWKLHVQGLSTLLKLEPQLEKADERTLSVYLPIRAEGFDAARYDILLKHTATDYARDLDEKLRPLLDSELSRLHTHLNLVRPAGGPGLVAFSNQGVDLMTLIRLPETVEPRIEVGAILLAPLELLLKHHPPTLIVVVDKTEARIFASVLAEVVQLDSLTGVPVRHVKSGGNSAPGQQRRADNRTRANLKKVIEVLGREVRRGEFTRIVVAGPEEARSEFLRELPKPLAALYAGSISASLDMSAGRLTGEIRDQLMRGGLNGAGTSDHA